MTIWDCRTHVRMTSMTSSVERTDLDFKISVSLILIYVYLLYVTDFIFYNFFYLHKCGKNIFTNKFSSSGIYRYFNSSVRRVKTKTFVLITLETEHCAVICQKS